MIETFRDNKNANKSELAVREAMGLEPWLGPSASESGRTGESRSTLNTWTLVRVMRASLISMRSEINVTARLKNIPFTQNKRTVRDSGEGDVSQDEDSPLSTVHNA